MDLSRRDFLKFFSQTAGCFVATASIAPLKAWSKPQRAGGEYSFPQGVASADPQPDTIVLWTRVVGSGGESAGVDLRVQVAREDTFSQVILEETIIATPTFDYTVRCLVDGLEPEQYYYYRFLAPDQTVSRLGRTRTAPPADTERPLVAAVCSCQRYYDGFFGTYRRLILDDRDAADDAKIDIVIHLGDFIYEGVQPLENDLVDRNGNPRVVPPLPSGGRTARSLADYRFVYQTYLTDPDLQEARAWFPWVVIWDDNEIGNDYWQSFQRTRPMQQRKVSGNQAWFEYVPAALAPPAHDFEPATVEDIAPGSFDENHRSLEPNSRRAVDTMSIYRTIQWGRMVDLVATDSRSYRGPRGIDDALFTSLIRAATPLPAELVRTWHAGSSANGGNPPETVEFRGQTMPNNRRDTPVSSLLGAEQKVWFKTTLTESTARWKLFLNAVPLMQFGFDLTFGPSGNPNEIWWADSWDGYPLEREELMAFIRDNRISNVISVTGDRHAHFAGMVFDSYDTENPRAVIPELAAAGMSSFCRVQNTSTDAIEGAPEGLVDYDPTTGDTTFNAWLLYGADAATALHNGASEDEAREAANPRVNPHLRYADTSAYGYFITRFFADRVDVEFVVVPVPEDYGESGPPVRRRVRMAIPAWDGGEEPQIRDVNVDGHPPILGFKL